MLCDLAERNEAYGRPWHVPRSGAESPRSILALAARLRDVGLKLRRGRRWMLVLAGLFNREIRAFKRVFPLYDRPVILDTRRIGELLGDLRLTPYAEGVRRTLDEFE